MTDVVIYHNPMCGTSRAALRLEAAPYAELGLAELALTGDDILDAMMAHPILIERPIVVAPIGVRICRPAEVVKALLPPPG